MDVDQIVPQQDSQSVETVTWEQMKATYDAYWAGVRDGRGSQTR